MKHAAPTSRSPARLGCLAAALSLVSLAAGAHAQTANARPPAAASVLLVVHADQPYVVLQAAPEAGWSTGAPALVSREDVVITRRAASRAVPAALAAWRGRAVRLYDAADARCTGRVGRLYVLHRVTPHFGALQEWNGDTDGDGTSDGPRASDARVAAEAFGLGGPDGSLLVGSLERRRGDCAGSVMATLASASAPGVLREQGTVEPELEARALAHLRGLPRWSALQAEYRQSEEAVRGGRWDEDPGATRQVRLFVDGSGRRVVLVSAAIDEEGCGDVFVGRLWAFVEVQPDRLVPIGRPGEDRHMAPVVLLDARYDGTLEVVVQDGRMQLDAEGDFELTESIQVPYLDCPC